MKQKILNRFCLTLQKKLLEMADENNCVEYSKAHEMFGFIRIPKSEFIEYLKEMVDLELVEVEPCNSHYTRGTIKIINCRKISLN